MENKEIVLESIFDLYLFICSLKMNKKTKTPSVNITQEQAMEILAKLDDLSRLLGKRIVMDNSSGELIVKMEEM